jgi:uncharacterized protein with PhoU and TrkA domain
VNISESEYESVVEAAQALDAISDVAGEIARWRRDRVDETEVK